MTKMQINQLEQRRARYAAKLGQQVAAMIESDTAVATMRMSERERPIAQRYREVVQQLASL